MKTLTYYDYYFKAENGQPIGEKLARSHSHAEKMRKNYEKKYNCSVEKTFLKKIIIKGGRCIYGF